ncbi:MAG TPA: DUF6049 family protein [Microbacterium sp.]|nr:DUF6049 family protein [Microbacterium sp.]
MTVTSPASGMTAGRDRSARRGLPLRPRRVAARTVAAIAVTLCAVFGTVVPATADATPEPTPSPSPGPPGGVRFTASPLNAGVVPEGGQLTVSLTITNDTPLTVPAGTLSLELGERPITDRGELEAWLAGDDSGVTTVAVAQTPAPALDATSAVTEGVVLPADDPALQDRGPGVYPLLGRYHRIGGDVVSTSALIVPRASGPTTPVGIVVPITAGTLTTGVLSADQLTALTTAGGALAEQLHAVEGTSAILAVDPAIAASIRVLGDAAPDVATEWLRELELLPNTRFALQYGDADVATQLAAGLPAPLQPTSLLSYMSPADFPETTPSPSPTPEETTAPVEPDYPDLDALLSIGGERAGVYWPAEGFADEQTVQTLGARQSGDVDAITIIPSASTGDADAAVPARATVGEAAALVYDSAVSTWLSEASVTTENVLRGRPLTAATALLSVATAAAAGTPLLIALDRAPDRSRIALSAAVDAAIALPTTRPSSLSDLVNATPHPTTVAQSGIDPARVAQASALFGDEDDLAAFSTILDDPSLLTGRERAELLQLLSVGWVADPAGWMQTAMEHREATTATLNAVSIVPPSHINLLNTAGPLQFWVRNALPYPVNVILVSTPDDLRLDVQRLTRVDGATAASNTRVAVPVEARIGSGDLTVHLQLRSPTGVEIGGPEFAEVSVRGDWEGIGIAIVLVLVGGLIVLGLVRTILHRRAERRAEEGKP